jgi:hypothetical protein
MRNASFRLILGFMAALPVTMFAAPQNLTAQSAQHVVSSSDLQQAVVDASQARQKNIDTLNNFLSSDKAKSALESAKIDPQQVKKAVAGLSDQDLANLASRAQKAQDDFAAGNIGDRDLLIILVCIAVLILLIVALR